MNKYIIPFKSIFFLCLYVVYLTTPIQLMASDEEEHEDDEELIVDSHTEAEEEEEELSEEEEADATDKLTNGTEIDSNDKDKFTLEKEKANNLKENGEEINEIAEKELGSTNTSTKTQLSEELSGANNNDNKAKSNANENSVDSDQKVADPVNVINGEFYETNTDISLGGLFNLQFTRSYSSQHHKWDLGYNWKHNFVPTLTIIDREFTINNITKRLSLIYAAEEDGSVFVYVPDDELAEPLKWKLSKDYNPELSNKTSSGIGGLNNKYNQTIEKSIVGTDTLYTLKGSDGSIRVFKMQSSQTIPYLDTWTDANGNFVKVDYYSDPNDFGYSKVSRIISNDERFLLFTYDRRNRLIKITSHDGRVVQYQYDDQHDLRKVILPDNTEIKYEYKIDTIGLSLLGNVITEVDIGIHSTHQIKKIIRPDSRILQNEYDDKGRVVKQWATVGNDLQIVRNATYVYGDLVELNGSISGWTRVYDVFNAPSGTPINDTNCTLYEYTDQQITKIKDPLGQSIEQEWYIKRKDFPEVNGARDSEGFIINELVNQDIADDIPGGYPRSLKWKKNKRGLITYYWYDSRGNIILQKVYGDITGDNQDDVATTTTTYNDKNLITKSIAPNGITTIYEYSYTNSNVTPEYTIGNKPTSIKVYSEDNPTGPPDSNKLMSQSDFVYDKSELGVATNTYAYGLLVEQKTRSDNDTYAYKTFSYDTRGLLNESIDYSTIASSKPTATTDSDIIQNFFYDYRGQVIEVNQFTDTVTSGSVSKFDYDMAGRPTERETFYKDANSETLLSKEYIYYNDNGEAIWVDGPRHGPEDYIFRDYDGAGRIIAEVKWRSRAKIDGSGVEAVPQQDDLLGQALTIYEYDGFGNLKKVIDPNNNYSLLEYDSIGQLIEQKFHDGQTDELLQVSNFEYEEGGKVSRSINPNGGVTLTEYTSTGQPKKQINPDGTVLEWRYDIIGRVQFEILPNKSFWRYIYNDQPDAISGITSVTKEFCTAPNENENYSNATAQFSEKSEFDRRGNLRNFTDAENNIFITKYDGLNRVIEESGPSSNATSKQQKTLYSYKNNQQVDVLNSALGTTQITTSQTIIEKVFESGGNEKIISTLDALGRSVKTEILNRDGTPAQLSHTIYASDFNSVIQVQGDPSDATEAIVKNKVFTDTFGNPVLSWLYKDASTYDYTINRFDKSGNLTESHDPLRQITQYTYDGLNRLKTTTLPDDAVTTLNYDAMGNLSQRIMPGGLTWNAGYDIAGRIQFEKLQNKEAVTRHFSYNYYNANSDYVGLPKIKKDELRNITHINIEYDALARLTNKTSAGNTSVYGYTKSYSYDFRNNLTICSLNYNDASLNSTTVVNTFDSYGQLDQQNTNVHTSTTSSSFFNIVENKWDEAGRRYDMNGTAFDYFANGKLKTITDSYSNNTYDYTYSKNGLLKSKENAWRTETITSRDMRGRITAKNITATGNVAINNFTTGQPILTENLTWRADSKISSYTTTTSPVPSGTWNDQRDYTYNPRGQLIKETYKKSNSETVTVDYGFDRNKLGVRTSYNVSGAATGQWKIPNGQLDPLAHMQQEIYNDDDIPALPANGLAVEADSVNLSLTHNPNDDPDQSPNETSYPVANFDPTDPSGAWSADLNLTKSGDYNLTATAKFANDSIEKSDSHNFTLGENSTNLSNDYIDTEYDAAGFIIKRTWHNDDTSKEKVQNYKWDALGNLIKISERDNSNNGYDWQAVYDGFGRRLRVTTTPVTDNNPDPLSMETVDSYFDPLVEFLEIGVKVNNETTWKIYGPDMNGVYGGLQGIGGLEATVNNTTLEVSVSITNAFGHIVAYTEPVSGGNDNLTWNETLVSGYGALPENEVKKFSTSGASGTTNNLLKANVWQGRRIDITGYYLMGARYYDPQSSRFLSPDPLGHAASMDLYSYANGDPINFVDPTGRNAVTDFIDEFNLLNPDSTIRSTHNSITSATGSLFSEGEASTSLFNDAMNTSTAGQLISQGASDSIMTAHNIALGTASAAGVIAGGGTILSGLATPVTVTTNVVSGASFTSTVGAEIGTAALKGAVGAGILAYEGAVTIGGIAETASLATAVRGSTFLASEAGKDTLVLGAGLLFTAGFVNNQIGGPINTTGFTGVDLGPLAGAETIFSLGEITSKTGTFLGNMGVGTSVGASEIGDPTGKWIKPPR